MSAKFVDNEYLKKAERILRAMENSPVPVEWSEMDREDLAEVIARELRKMDKEDATKE